MYKLFTDVSYSSTYKIGVISCDIYNEIGYGEAIKLVDLCEND